MMLLSAKGNGSAKNAPSPQTDDVVSVLVKEKSADSPWPWLRPLFCLAPVLLKSDQKSVDVVATQPPTDLPIKTP